MRILYEWSERANNNTNTRVTTMKTAQVNVFRDGATWCASTWIGGEFDSSDPIGIDDGASEAEAMAAATAAYDGRCAVVVRRIEDCDTSR